MRGTLLPLLAAACAIAVWATIIRVTVVPVLMRAPNMAHVMARAQ